MKNAKITAWDYLWYALYAFAGLGLELFLLGVVEPFLFGNISSDEYSVFQRIIHWTLTMICWGSIAALLVYFAGKKLDFHILRNVSVTKKGVLAALVLVIVCIAVNAIDWGTLKIIGEFQQKGPLLFLFQYLYYAFEIGLVFLITAFGQGFAEMLLKRKSMIPFGGIVLCCTWGAIHMLSQGSVATGLGVMVFALLYGLIYIFLNRSAKYSYTAMLLAFIL